MLASHKYVKDIRARIARHRSRRMGIIKKKVLLLLSGGLALGLSGSPRTSWRILGAVRNEWKELSKQSIERAIDSLYASKLVDVRANADKTLTLTINKKGRRIALTYDLVRMKIERARVWDKHWRMVSFDIPEDERESRDAFRQHLLRLGFFELHQSFFVYPFDCQNEIDFLVSTWGIGKYVRYIVASHINTEDDIKDFFELN